MVVDLEMGNVGSVANMFRKIGVDAVVTGEPTELIGAERLVLPGVGAFDEAMGRLENRGFLDVLHRLVIDEATPVLGICLGMQLLASASEEGVLPGLGWIPGSVERLPAIGPAGPVKVPHMGWSSLHTRRAHSLTAGLNEDSRFYFVHSYALHPSDRDDVVATAVHCGTEFTAVVARGHITGVQFHPEKSHRHGMALLRRFAADLP